MSKQSTAKIGQGYCEKAPTCQTCKNRVFKMRLPTWMDTSNKESIAKGEPARYGDAQQIAKGHKCKIGGFAVKAQAYCSKHELVEVPADAA